MRRAPFAVSVLALPTHHPMGASVTGKACIACHKSIAPELPKDDKDPNQ